MFSVIRNVQRILFKRKSFILTSFILPIGLVFLFAVLYGSNSSYKIAMINMDKGELGDVIKERVLNIEGITLIDEEENSNYEEKLIFHEIEMVIKVEENYTDNLINGEKGVIKINSISQGELETRITQILNSETNSLANMCNNIDVEKVGVNKIIDTFKESKPTLIKSIGEKEKVSINTSLGIMLYLIFLCAGISCGFLLEDEREGTKSRVLMGDINEKEYYGGLGIVFFLLTSIPAIEYYVVCKVFGFNFGFNNTIVFLLLLLLLVLFAVSFNIFLSSIIKKKTALTMVNSAIMVPVFMLSGAFWPFDLMGEGIRKIGSALPPRWLMYSIECLQMGKGIESVIPTVLGILSIVILLFLMSIFFTRNKIVLVKDN